MRSVPEATGRTIELESGAVDLSLIIHVNDIKRISIRWSTCTSNRRV